MLIGLSMAFIGEEHYCAQISDDFQKDAVIACKEIDPDRSKIVGLIVRITAQLAELSLSFKKFKNTRDIYLGDKTMTISFYYDDKFYVQSHISHFPASFILKATQIGKVIQTIIDDLSCPLFRYMPKPITHEELYENILS